MRFIYNVLFTIFFVLCAPYYFLKMWRRGNWQSGFAQRFAFYSPEIKEALAKRPVIWLHAVSVGEVGVCVQLIRLLAPRVPECQLVVSTTTSTGMGELRKKLPADVLKIYYPADFWWGVRRAFDTIQPKAVVLIEAEFWPNFLWRANARKIPLFLVNARVSDRSFRGYRRCGFIFRDIFRQFRAAGCLNSTDATRLEQLGFCPEGVHILGNLKFDAALPSDRPGLDVPALLRQIGVPEKARLIVCGSTHAGEEAILGQMFLRLRQRFPDIFLVLVPRHFERAKAVAGALQQCGLKFILRADIGPATQLPDGQLECLLVNSTGELMFFYGPASVVFVGKSLTAKGGQNPIEPGALGKALVFGPNMQNFTSVVAAFLDNDAAIQVADAAQLERVFGELLEDEARCRQLGANALRVVRENTGATARTAELIARTLQDRPKCCSACQAPNA